MAHILIVDDQKAVVDTCRLYLERAGHGVTVAYNGEQALAEAARVKPDLIVLDLLLPRVDGRDVCRALRAGGARVPILMLSALATEDDRIAGLELGADDYLVKPFSPRELVARVGAILRRAPAADDAAVLRFEGFELDRGAHVARAGGQELALTPREFALLEVFATHPFRAFTRAQLIERAFGDESEVLERTVDAHVMNLRRRLEAGEAPAVRIVTVFGVGYRLEGTPCE